MSWLPTSLMILSAIFHAIIGLLMKQSRDKTLFRAMLALISAVAVIPVLFFLPPPPLSAWPYLIGGAALHFIYQLAQIKAFETGDMSLVYPIMRGTAPALAAIFAVFILQEHLSPVSIIGLLMATGALIAFGFSGINHHSPSRFPQKKAIGFALFCGIMTALYSVIDAGGIRLTREFGIIAPSYIAWFFLLDGIGLPLTAIIKEKRQFIRKAAPDFKRAIWAGLFSLTSYGAALYALALAPVGKMAALRETSVVFAALLASFILKESFGSRRILFAVILTSGLIVMQMG